MSSEKPSLPILTTAARRPSHYISLSYQYALLLAKVHSFFGFVWLLSLECRIHKCLGSVTFSVLPLVHGSWHKEDAQKVFADDWIMISKCFIHISKYDSFFVPNVLLCVPSLSPLFSWLYCQSMIYFFFFLGNSFLVLMLSSHIYVFNYYNFNPLFLGFTWILSAMTSVPDFQPAWHIILGVLSALLSSLRIDKTHLNAEMKCQ